MTYIYDRDKIDELLSVLNNDDVVQISGEDLITLLGKNSKSSKGRKPIDIDTQQFAEIVSRWQNGEITARAAMNALDLKPNTFYRRVKEFGEINMKELHEVKKEIRDAAKAEKAEIKNLEKQVHKDAKEAKSDIKELKKQLHSDGEAVKSAVSDRKELLDMERDIRLGKIQAELAHAEEIGTLKDAVAKETEEYKNSQL